MESGSSNNQPTLASILERLNGLEETQARTMAALAQLGGEIADATGRIEELEFSHSSALGEINKLLEKLAKQISSASGKPSAKGNHRSGVVAAMPVAPAAPTSDGETSSASQLKMENEKLERELREARIRAEEAREELKRERQARELMEEVCNELAREIGEDKAEVEQLKQQQARSRERVEEELRNIRLAEQRREERVRAKLVEAQRELNGMLTLQELTTQLQSFITAKLAAANDTSPPTSASDAALQQVLHVLQQVSTLDAPRHYSRPLISSAAGTQSCRFTSSPAAALPTYSMIPSQRLRSPASSSSQNTPARSSIANSLPSMSTSPADAAKSSPHPLLYVGGSSAASGANTPEIIATKPCSLSEYEADYTESELDDFFVIDHHLHRSPNADVRPETPRLLNNINPGYEEIDDTMSKVPKQGSDSSSTASTSSKRSSDVDCRTASTPPSAASASVRVRNLHDNSHRPAGVAKSSSYSSASAAGRRVIKPEFCWSNLASPDAIARTRHPHLLPASENRSGRKSIEQTKQSTVTGPDTNPPATKSGVLAAAKKESVASAMAKEQQVQESVSRSKMSGMIAGLKSNSLRAQLLKAKAQESTTGQSKPTTPTKSSFRLISPLRRRNESKK